MLDASKGRSSASYAGLTTLATCSTMLYIVLFCFGVFLLHLCIFYVVYSTYKVIKFVVEPLIALTNKWAIYKIVTLNKLNFEIFILKIILKRISAGREIEILKYLNSSGFRGIAVDMGL